MKHWVITATIDPSKIEGVVSARGVILRETEDEIESNLSHVIFAAYSRALRQWFWVYPSGERAIQEPQMLLLDEEWVRANRILSTSDKAIKRDRQRPIKKKLRQLELF